MCGIALAFTPLLLYFWNCRTLPIFQWSIASNAQISPTTTKSAIIGMLLLSSGTSLSTDWLPPGCIAQTRKRRSHETLSVS